MTKAEGIFGCTVLSGKAGEDNGVTTVQINAMIDDGPSKGQRCTYEDVVNAQSAKYVRWSCVAVGWRESSLKTLESDIAAWIAKTGGKTTVEIKHIEIKKGKAFDKWADGGRIGERPVWDKVSGLGRGAAKPLSPLGASLKDADDAMRSVTGYTGGPPSDDAPVDDDIPFTTCSMSSDVNPIAKVLR